MLALEQRFRCPEEIAAKVMDGEAVMINLANGVYYSMDKVGAVIWSMIETGRSLDEIAAALTARYDVSLDDARADVLRLAEEILSEDLLVPMEGAGPPNQREAPASARHAYEPPVLNVYRDIGDLLALDPPVPGLGQSWEDPGDEPTG